MGMLEYRISLNKGQSVQPAVIGLNCIIIKKLDKTWVAIITLMDISEVSLEDRPQKHHTSFSKAKRLTNRLYVTLKT